MAILGFVLIAMLTLWRVPGAILIGILLGRARPSRSASPVCRLDGSARRRIPRRSCSSSIFAPRSRWPFFGVLLTIFVMALVDTLGTLIGVSERAGFLDERRQSRRKSSAR